TLIGTQWRLPEIFSLVVDNQKNVWVDTSAGLYRLDANWSHSAPVRVAGPAFGDPQQRFSAACLDPDGRVWTAAERGIFVLDAHGWHKIDLGTAGANFDVIAIDQQGYLWAAGASQELERLRVENFRVAEVKPIG